MRSLAAGNCMHVLSVQSWGLSCDDKILPSKAVVAVLFPACVFSLSSLCYIFIVGYFCRLMAADKSRVAQISNSICRWDTRVNQHETQKGADGRGLFKNARTLVWLWLIHKSATRQTDERINPSLMFVYPRGVTTCPSVYTQKHMYANNGAK